MILVSVDKIRRHERFRLAFIGLCRVLCVFLVSAVFAGKFTLFLTLFAFCLFLVLPLSKRITRFQIARRLIEKKAALSDGKYLLAAVDFAEEKNPVDSHLRSLVFDLAEKTDFSVPIANKNEQKLAAALLFAASLLFVAQIRLVPEAKIAEITILPQIEQNTEQKTEQNIGQNTEQKNVMPEIIQLEEGENIVHSDTEIIESMDGETEYTLQNGESLEFGETDSISDNAVAGTGSEAEIFGQRFRIGPLYIGKSVEDTKRDSWGELPVRKQFGSLPQKTLEKPEQSVQDAFERYTESVLANRP